MYYDTKYKKNYFIIELKEGNDGYG